MNEDIVSDIPELECWELLRAHEFGRLAYHLLDEVNIAPINYCVVDEKLVLKTTEGSKMLGIVLNSNVAFEIDRIGDDRAESVVVQGRARDASPAEEEAMGELPLRSWVDTVKTRTIIIDPETISGRRFVLRPRS